MPRSFHWLERKNHDLRVYSFWIKGSQARNLLKYLKYWFPLMLSMCENLLLDGWAWAKIGYSLTGHAWKLVTHWLTICKNLLLSGWACARIISAHQVHFSVFLSSPLSPIPLSPFPVLVRRPLSPLSHLCTFSHVFWTLSPILCPLSHVSVPWLPSTVPSLTSLFLVYCPLSPVSRLCSWSPFLCTLSHVIWSLSPILLSPSTNPYQLSHL